MEFLFFLILVLIIQNPYCLSVFGLILCIFYIIFYYIFLIVYSKLERLFLSVVDKLRPWIK